MNETVPESDDTEDSVYVRKPVMFLGRDLTQVACFRKSFIFGISCAVAGGLFCFLATSRGQMSVNVGFCAGGMGVVGCWIPCRLKYEKENMILHINRNYGSIMGNDES